MMLDHVGFAVSDYDRAKAFCGAVGAQADHGAGRGAAGFGTAAKPWFWAEALGKPVRGRLDIALGADSRNRRLHQRSRGKRPGNPLPT
jgi:hypothetical protein